MKYSKVGKRDNRKILPFSSLPKNSCFKHLYISLKAIQRKRTYNINIFNANRAKRETETRLKVQITNY